MKNICLIILAIFACQLFQSNSAFATSYHCSLINSSSCAPQIDILPYQGNVWVNGVKYTKTSVFRLEITRHSIIDFTTTSDNTHSEGWIRLYSGGFGAGDIKYTSSCFYGALCSMNFQPDVTYPPPSIITSYDGKCRIAWRIDGTTIVFSNP